MPQQLLARLPLSARDYLQSFGLLAVAVSSTGRVSCTPDPQGMVLAWWCPARDARRVASEAKFNGDVPEAARRLGVRLTEHQRVLERTLERTAKLEAALREATAAGLLSFFNSQYRHRRLAAARAGQNFMNYTAARRRLHAAITATIAHGGVVDRDTFQAVFEPTRPLLQEPEPLSASPAAAQP